jgi:hypothetical protein
MATTSNTYTGNGTNKLFSITFPYLDTSDINVYLNGVLQTITTQYTFANATTVEFVTAPSNGAEVLLDRSTDDTALQATFFPGSSIKADDLNFNFDQVLYLAQETANSAANQSTAGLQTQITAATNTANNAITTANTANATANAANTTANGIAGTANTALTTAQAAETTANAIAGTANTALSNSSTAVTTANNAVTTANAALPLAGGTMTGVITYATAQPRLVRGTSVATTSGTSIDFTGIPSWVKRVTVMLNGVSLTNFASQANSILVQLGDSGGVENSSYTQGSGYVGATAGIYTRTDGFHVGAWNTGANTVQGMMQIANHNGNLWCASGVLYHSSGFTVMTAGSKTLSGTLDRISITTGGGTDTFDAGSINILYEG